MKLRVALVLTIVAMVLAAGALPAMADTEVEERVYGPMWLAVGERSFAYATFEYPGDMSQILIEAHAWPGDPMTLDGVTMKLYRPDGSEQAAAAKTHGLLTIDTACQMEGTYTIEIANYNAKVPMTFALVVKGPEVSEVTVAEVAVEEAVVEDEEEVVVEEEEEVVVEEEEEVAVEDEEVAVVEEEEGVFGPVWIGVGEKRFAYATFEYAGDLSEMTVEVYAWPGDPLTLKGVTVKLYAPDGTVLGTADKTHGLLSLTGASDVEGTFTLEIANYNAKIPMTFALVAKGTGISDVAVQMVPVDEPEVEVVVEDEEEVVVEDEEEVVVEDEEEVVVDMVAVEMSEEGVYGPAWLSMAKGFANLQFDYPGDGSAIKVEVYAWPGDPMTLDGVTVKLYRPDGSEKATAGKSHGVLTIDTTCMMEGTYRVEIANYTTVPMTYAVVISGAEITNVMVPAQ